MAAPMPQPICAAILAKVLEQIERVEHLIALLPPDSMVWQPPIDRPWTTGKLLGHLIACLAGFCAVLHAAQPERLAHFQELRKLPPAPEVELDPIRGRIRLFSERIVEGFDSLEDSSLARLIPTVFVPAGESVMALLLGNLEHLINHKHQLFTYLRLMNVAVESRDLYRFRG
jgi:hypothetical protein